MTTTEELELAQAAISGIAAIIETVMKAKSGKVDPGAAQSALSALVTSLAENDKAADSALDAKFPK